MIDVSRHVAKCHAKGHRSRLSVESGGDRAAEYSSSFKGMCGFEWLDGGTVLSGF